MVTFSSVTVIPGQTANTVPLSTWPSIIVVAAPEPIRFKLDLMRTCSLYVPGAILTESPEAANEMAWPMVRQATVADRQLLVSLPVDPLTYQVVAARATGAWVSSSAIVTRIELQVRLFMVISSELQASLPDTSIECPQISV
jgi:hypothetical protein